MVLADTLLRLLAICNPEIWLIRSELLWHRHLIIKIWLRCYEYPAVSLSVLASTYAVYPNPFKQTDCLYTHSHSASFQHTHTKKTVSRLTHDSVYICLSAGERGDKISGMETHLHSAQICNIMVHQSYKGTLQISCWPRLKLRKMVLLKKITIHPSSLF